MLGGSAGLPVRLLIQRGGDITFGDLLKRLRCKRCGKAQPRLSTWSARLDLMRRTTWMAWKSPADALRAAWRLAVIPISRVTNT